MFPTTFFSFLLTFQTRPSSLVPKPPSPTTSLQVLQALPHNSPSLLSLITPRFSPLPSLLTSTSATSPSSYKVSPFMSLMIPFFLSSPILPHIFLSPTLTFLQAPLHFPHDPLTALSLSFPFISLQFHTSTPTSLQALLHSPHDPLLNLQSHPSAHLPTPPPVYSSPGPGGKLLSP